MGVFIRISFGYVFVYLMHIANSTTATTNHWTKSKNQKYQIQTNRRDSVWFFFNARNRLVGKDSYIKQKILTWKKWWNFALWTERIIIENWLIESIQTNNNNNNIQLIIKIQRNVTIIFVVMIGKKGQHSQMLFFWLAVLIFSTLWKLLWKKEKCI